MPSADFAHTFLNKFIGSQALMPEQKQKGFPTMMPGPQSPAPSSYPSFGPRVDPTAGASTYQRSFQDYANFR